MKKIVAVSAVLVMVVGVAIAQNLIGYSSIPVTGTLYPELRVESDPVRIDHGYINLNAELPISNYINVETGNVPGSLWVTVVDEEGGWELGSKRGVDTYMVKILDTVLTGEAQQIYSAVGPYTTNLLPIEYYPPTVDTQGAGVEQNYILLIEARTDDYTGPPEE